MTKSSHHWAIFFANIGHTLTHLMMLLYPTVVLTLGTQMNLSYGALMWLSVPGLVLYGFAALPAGWLGDRWSAEHMMVLFFTGSGVAGIATAFAQGPVGLACGLAAIGFFGAIYHPVGTAWLVRHAENRGKMLGWNGIFGSLGVGAGPIVGASLAALYGWRAAFLVPGIVSLLLGGALLVLVRGGTVVAAKTDLKPQAEPLQSDVRRVFALLSITMLSTGITFQALTSVLPKLFEVRLIDVTAGGLVGTGGMVSLVFALSAVPDARRYGSRPLLDEAHLPPVLDAPSAGTARSGAVVRIAALCRVAAVLQPDRNFDADRERALGALHAVALAGDRLRREVPAVARRQRLGRAVGGNGL
jgi:FSR family fosmidomycin resistance protein-like MFS transporter